MYWENACREDKTNLMDMTDDALDGREELPHYDRTD
jgi:hypothetical protein